MMKNQLRIMRFDAVDLAHALSGRITKKEGSESSTRELGYANNASPSNTTFNLSKVADNHGNRRNLTYAYLINSANVDGKEYVVTIVVRQSPDRNKFWMHEIRLDTKKEESDLSIRSDHSDRLQTSSKARIPYGNVSQSAENVKRENENLTTIRNLNEDDLAAMYESPGIPVKSMLADEDGAGDVSLVLRSKDADSDSANLLDMVAVVPDSADGWLLDKLKMNGLRVVGYKSVNLWEMPWR